MEGGAQLHVWNMIMVESGGTVVGCWKKKSRWENLSASASVVDGEGFNTMKKLDDTLKYVLFFLFRSAKYWCYKTRCLPLWCDSCAAEACGLTVRD